VICTLPSCPSPLLFGSTLPPPPISCVNKHTAVNVYMYTFIQCVGGGGHGVLGLRLINTCANSLCNSVFRWRHFAWPSVSLIFLATEHLHLIYWKLVDSILSVWGSGPQTDKHLPKIPFAIQFLDEEILHCLLWVLSFYATEHLHRFYWKLVDSILSTIYCRF
jgi:hypothetical protein